MIDQIFLALMAAAVGFIVGLIVVRKDYAAGFTAGAEYQRKLSQSHIDHHYQDDTK